MIKSTTKTLGIVGKGPGWWEAKDCDELWGLNCIHLHEHNRFQGKWDRIFHLHRWGLIESVDPETLPRCLEKGIPLVTLEEKPGCELCSVYPFEEVSSFFGTNYFCNNASYVIAYAAMLKPEKIRIWGVNHTTADYSDDQKCCVSYWVGRAEGMGIEVELSHHSAIKRLPNGKLYGYET